MSNGKLEVLQFDTSDVYDIGNIVTSGARSVNIRDVKVVVDELVGARTGGVVCSALAAWRTPRAAEPGFRSVNP